MLRFCPYCEDVRETIEKLKDEVWKIKEVDVPVNATVIECLTCRGEFASTETEEGNFKKAYSKYDEFIKAVDINVVLCSDVV